MRKVVVASDSFKGCLTSAQVADAVEKGIHEVYPKCEVVKLAVADGGEGTMAALMSTVGGERHAVTVHDPVGRQIEASYALINGNTAVIEMASASGLTLLEPHERNPLLTSTYGTGELIVEGMQKVSDLPGRKCYQRRRHGNVAGVRLSFHRCGRSGPQSMWGVASQGRFHSGKGCPSGTKGIGIHCSLRCGFPVLRS